jgi:hypothetical protein
MGLARVRTLRRAHWAIQIAFQKPRQKPSSARPTQLNANIEEAIATTDAKVTMVLTDGITEPRCRQR